MYPQKGSSRSLGQEGPKALSSMGTYLGTSVLI